MGVMPDKLVGKLEFCEDHVTPFLTNAVAIGTTVVAATEFQTKTVAARAAWEAKRAADIASRDATINWHDTLRAAVDAGAAIVKQVRGRAATGGDPIYSLAGLPVPATPSPVGPLGQPYDFKVELNANGSLTLTWKCNNPRAGFGLTYQVWRQIGSGPMLGLGGSGVKMFVDETLPSGASEITYQFQATRSNSVGPWASYTVKLGNNTTTVTPTTPVSIAA